MEKAEHGAALLALSTDVNENEEISKSYTPLSDCKTDTSSCLLKLSKNQACSEIRKSDETRKGYVFIADETIVNADSQVLSSQSIHAGDGKMLDFITDCIPGIKDNCVIPNRCNDATLNGFSESSEELMVGSKAGGGDTEGTPSSLDCVTTAGGEQVNRILPDGISSMARETENPSPEKREKSRSNCETELQSTVPLSLSCDGRHQQNCTCTATPVANENLSNGDVQQGAHSSKTILTSQIVDRPTVLSKSRGAFGKEVANGGMLMVHKKDVSSPETDVLGKNADIPDSVDTPNSNTQNHIILSPASCGNGSQEFSCVREGAVLCKEQHKTLRDEGIESCQIYSVQSANNNFSALHAKDKDNFETDLKEAFSDESISSRPLTLRTNPKNTVSLSCDATPIGPEDGEMFNEPPGQLDARFMDGLSSRNTFESSRRQSAPDNIPDGLTAVSDSSDQELKPKKYGISEFFGRSLFSRKLKEPKPPSQSAPGWKLFGKVPLRENPQKDSRTIQQESNPGGVTSVSTPNLLNTGEYEARVGKACCPPSQTQQGRRKNLEFEPLSTTALILEDRPANLPAKSVEEAQRHRQEYDEMVAEAKKREMKEAQRKKKQMKERFKHEDIIANAMVIWNNEILPNWESMRNTRRVRELWWQGLPPSVRGRVWSLAVGNELNITHELYEIFLSRARERWRSFSETGSENDAEDSGASLADRESSLDLIKLDISRTFPSLYIFQKGGPYHDLLHSVLGAYTCYRPDVGYVQGMSFIAAVLILNLEEADAFIAFANLLNKPCQMAFFRVDHDLMLKYFAAFEVFFEENLPRLFNHFQSYNLTPDLYLIDWIFTLYSKSLPLDLACRVWDVFCRDGEEYLFRTGLGILRLYEEVLLQMDFIHIAQFLTRLPEDIGPDRLFGCIAAVQMLSNNKKWTQVFSALMKDNKEVDRIISPAQKS